MDELGEFLRAGELAREIKKKLEQIVEPGARVLEITEFIEGKIKENGFFPGFPVNIGINEVAAHYTARINDELRIPENSVVKIDFGIRTSSGLVVDTAITFDFGEHDDLVLAAKEALEAAENVLMNKGGEATLGEIGRAIENAIRERGFEPIRNLSGHEIRPWNLHAGLSIPNFDSRSEKKLGSGVFAIEPFATSGRGLVKDSVKSEIFSLVSERQVRLKELRRVLERIKKEFRTLPFAARWIGELQPLKLLSMEGVLHNYAVLVEVENGLVSQFEHTYYIEGKKVIRVS